MSDTVRITFTADISDLQRGLDAATSGIAETSAVLKSGADQVGLAYGDLTRAYAAGAARRLDLVRKGNDDELAVARAGDRAQTEIALDGIKIKQSQVKEQAQLSQISHEEERAQLLALEDQRVDIERAHLLFLQSTYRDNAQAFATTQRQIDVLAAGSAVKRQEIERSYLREVDADYRRTFEQVGSSVSQQVMGMIRGQETLRKAVGNVLLSIIQSFIQARIRSVADWAAGVAAETAATTAGETTKTSAVLAGTATRQAAQTSAATASAATTLSAIVKSIMASAAETFAGIFGFLSPIMGPAAAGPAAAGQATVMAAAGAIPSHAVGSWSLPSDMLSLVHKGEMIVPAAATPWAQSLMANAAGSGSGSGGGDTHIHNWNISTNDARSFMDLFKTNSREAAATIEKTLRLNSGLLAKR